MPLQLDEALDFNGNVFFGAIGNCCIGCACWQRCFNCMPRWSLTCAALAIVYVAAPWAFRASMSTVNNGKSECLDPFCHRILARCWQHILA